MFKKKNRVKVIVVAIIVAIIGFWKFKSPTEQDNINETKKLA